MRNIFTDPVIPAKAGTQNFKQNKVFWVPAFAGMTRREGAGMG